MSLVYQRISRNVRRSPRNIRRILPRSIRSDGVATEDDWRLRPPLVEVAAARGLQGGPRHPSQFCRHLHSWQGSPGKKREQARFVLKGVFPPGKGPGLRSKRQTSMPGISVISFSAWQLNVHFSKCSFCREWWLCGGVAASGAPGSGCAPVHTGAAAPGSWGCT